MKGSKNKKRNGIVYRLLHPKAAGIFVCIATTILAEIYVFGFHHQESVLAYVTYLFSAYTLVISLIGYERLVKYIRELIQEDRIWIFARLRRLLEKNQYTRRYLYDADFRAVVGLRIGLVVNILYAFMKIGSGVFFRSLWFLGIGIYYVVLALTRMILLRDDRLRTAHVSEEIQMVHAFKIYRFCGCLMMLMDITMAGLLVQMVWQNRSYTYPGLAIFASAAFAFYSFIVAVVNMIKFAGNRNPILVAAKNITFVGASMSILALQTAMLSTFGEGDRDFARLMNSVTGGIVCSFVVGLATYMIIRGDKALKKMRKEQI